MHYLFSDFIDFSNFPVQQLVFENPKDLGIMVKELYDQSRGAAGRFSLLDEGRELNLAKEMLLVQSPIGLDNYDKLIIAGVIGKMLKQSYSPEYQSDIYNTLARLEVILSNALDDAADNISDLGVSVNGVLKSMSPRVIHCEDICEDLIQFCKLLSEYSDKKLIVLCNPFQFIDPNKRIEFMKVLAYYNIPIIVIDSIHVSGFPCKIFDRDFCEININNSNTYIFDV